MTAFRMLVCSVFAALLAGCATPSIPAETVHDPIGPVPSQVTEVKASGYLKVFSDTCPLGMATDDKLIKPLNPHMDYTISDSAGNKIKRVDNTVKNSDDPAGVSLRAGTYTIRARAAKIGMVSVPVVIRGGQETDVHLDGNWKPSGEFKDADMTRLTNGNIIGWRASQQ